MKPLGWLYYFHNQWCLIDEPGWEKLDDDGNICDQLRPWYAPIEDEE